MMMSKSVIKVANLTPLKSGGSSKGCMSKYYCNEKWYKEDSVGFESLAEVLCSRAAHLLSINLPSVDYSLAELQYANGLTIAGCESASYLSTGDSEITLRRLVERSICHRIANDSEYFLQAVELLGKLGGQHLLDQLSCLFQLDRLFINCDRHLNNIVIKNQKDLISFDYGDALGADISYEFPETMTAKECILSARAKPTLNTHDYQCDLLQLYSDYRLSLQSSSLYVSDLVGNVNKKALSRMQDILSIQFRHYLNTKLIFV